ncbi:hypothetical protein J1N35_041043 [Gossypium stocksii]|uniref:Uncharacterized protein n=1 Tax=Gossypium stocksii TaxID=47602 RepID=A0A9D3UEV7_9ROSI|nr:hypothetical protein J1N35_041043 [Gossypium stocksii]
MDDAEKEGRRRKAGTHMEDFREVLEELALVDIKPSRGWFTWMLMLLDIQNQITMLCYWTQWRAKEINKNSWCSRGDNTLEKLDGIREVLRPWQFNKYNRIRAQIRELTEQIDRTINGPITTSNINNLRETRIKLGKLYTEEEGYWAQRSRINWLREGDRSTKFFHMRATSRHKKNNIKRFRGHGGIWVYDTKGICKIAGDYFQNLFTSSIINNNELEMSYIPKCVDHEINDMFMKKFTDEEILAAFNQMDPRKVSDIDGLLGFFFQKN